MSDAKDMIRRRTQHIALGQDSKGLGTGVVVAADGWILTNRHVAWLRSFRVRFVLAADLVNDLVGGAHRHPGQVQAQRSGME